MANTVLTVMALASQAATATSAAVDVTTYGALTIELDITNVSGTNPTLDVVIQHRATDLSTWSTLYTFTQKTAIGTYSRAIPNTTEFGFLKDIRASYTIGGTNTPTFTFSLFAVAREAT